MNIQWVEAEALEQPGGEQLLDGADGILVPGGFGDRGTRGMMTRRRDRARARHSLLRHLLRLPVGDRRVRAQRLRARPTPTRPSATPDTPHKVIYKLRDLLGVDDLGGTMRLGTLRVRARRRARSPQRVYGDDADPRAASPPLRVQLPVRAGARPSTGLRDRPAARPTASSSRSSSCPAIRGTSRCSSIRSSSRSRCKPHPLFAGFVEASYRHKTGAPRQRRRRASRGRIGGVTPVRFGGVARSAAGSRSPSSPARA